MNISDIVCWNKLRVNPMVKPSRRNQLIKMLQITSDKIASEDDDIEKKYLQKINDHITSILASGKYMVKLNEKGEFPNGKIVGVIHNLKDILTIKMDSQNTEDEDEDKYFYIKNIDTFRQIKNNELISINCNVTIDKERIDRILNDYLYITEHPYGVNLTTEEYQERYYDVDQLRFLANTLCIMIEYAILSYHYDHALSYCNAAMEVYEQLLPGLGRPSINCKVKNFNHIIVYARILSEHKDQ